jgi:hypothetical protein
MPCMRRTLEGVMVRASGRRHLVLSSQHWNDVLLRYCYC